MRTLASAFLLAIVSGAGCKTAPTPDPVTHPAVVTEAQTPKDDVIGRLADAIDPGPQPPLSSNVPELLRETLGVENKPPRPALVELIRKPLTVWEELPDDVGQAIRIQALLAIGNGIVLAEKEVEKGADADLEVLVTLERLYHIIDAPHIGEERGIFGSFMGMFAVMASAEGHHADAKQLEDMSQFVLSSLRRAGKLHRRTLAQIMRRAPDHPGLPDALQRAANSLTRQDRGLALELMQTSVQMRGAKNEASHFLVLAQICYGALELECGDAAVKEAKSRRGEATEKEELTKQFTSADESAREAHRVVELKSATGVKERLELAGLLLELGRYDEATALYETLIAELPKDARPVAGLARLKMHSHGDVHGGFEVIDRAGPDLTNKEQAYYEIAIGLRAMTIFYEVMPLAAQKGMEAGLDAAAPILAKIRRDVLEFEKLGSDDAVVLHEILNGADEIIPMVRTGRQGEITGWVRKFLERATKLYERAPKNYHAYSVMMGATMFSPDRKSAVEASRRRLTGSDRDDEGAIRRAQTMLDHAVNWHDDALLSEVEAEADSLPEAYKKTRLLADIVAIRARKTGDADKWKAAGLLYGALLPEQPGKEHAGLLNNLAVCLAEQGQDKEALQLWARAADLDEDKASLPKINAAATRRSKSDLAALAAEADEGSDDSDALAARWMVELAPDRATKRRYQKEARKREKEALAANWRPGKLLPGPEGVLLEGTANVNISYSTIEGLVLILDVGSELWLARLP